MNFQTAKTAVDIDAARHGFDKKSSIELDGLVAFFRQQIVDEEWQIARSKKSIEAYQAVIDQIEKSRKGPD